MFLPQTYYSSYTDSQRETSYKVHKKASKNIKAPTTSLSSQDGEEIDNRHRSVTLVQCSQFGHTEWDLFFLVLRLARKNVLRKKEKTTKKMTAVDHESEGFVM